jgi:hypothetical protein
MMINRYLAATVATLLATCASSSASTTLSGTFAHDNDKARISFVVGPKASTVTLTSAGYASGGFDPVFSLYRAGGHSVAFNDDAGSPDSKLIETLAPGYYALYVTQYNNFGPIDLTLSDFPFDGVPDFRGGFIDSYGNQRTGFWSVTLDGIAAVPEAANAGLLGLGVVAMFAARPRRASRG